MAIITLLSLMSGGARAYDAQRPGTPRAQLIGSGLLEGWTFTYEGAQLCDAIDVRSYDHTIVCEMEAE
jgi:hypothetical protein